MAHEYATARRLGYERLASVMPGHSGWRPSGLSITPAWIHTTGAMIVSAPERLADLPGHRYEVAWRVGVSENTDGWRQFAGLSDAVGYGLAGAGTAGYVYAHHEHYAGGSCEWVGRSVTYTEHERGRKCPQGCPTSYTVLKML